MFRTLWNIYDGVFYKHLKSVDHFVCQFLSDFEYQVIKCNVCGPKSKSKFRLQNVKFRLLLFLNITYSVFFHWAVHMDRGTLTTLIKAIRVVHKRPIKDTQKAFKNEIICKTFKCQRKWFSLSFQLGQAKLETTIFYTK